jgi:site-specific DNA recombinase
VIAGTYSRYSTDNQRDASIEDQERAQDERAARDGWSIATHLRFSDRAISGARLDRPDYMRMMAAAERREFNVLLVWDLYRLGRDQVEALRAMRTLKFHGVRVIGVSDGIDSERRGAKLEVGMRALMGEAYLDDLAESVHRGLTGLALKGYSAGGLPYGYRSIRADNDAGYLREVDEAEAAWVQWIYQRSAAGWRPGQIAAELNTRGIPGPSGQRWTDTAIRRDSRRGTGILGNPLYTGLQVWNRSRWVKDPATGRRKRVERPRSEWISSQNEALRIVPETLWNAQDMNTPQVRPITGRPPKYLFSGLLKCGACGANYVLVGERQYGCANARKGRPCGNRATVSRLVVEDRLLTVIRQELLDETAFKVFEREARRILEHGHPDLDHLHQDLTRATLERDNILAAIKDGIRTASTLQLLQSAESAVEVAQKALDTAKAYQTSHILPRARETYRALVAQLETIVDVEAARKSLKAIFGEVKLVPESHGLVAEIPRGLAGLNAEIKLVAGVGFEPTTFGL